MNIFLTVLLALALIGVLVVLALGLTSLFRGGDPRRSNKLMQSRVALQALALLLLGLLMLIGKR